MRFRRGTFNGNGRGFRRGSGQWPKVKEYSTLHEHGIRHEVSHLIHYDSLLQNATDIITKCEIYSITKYDGTLLQNATVITKCDVYYKLPVFLDITKLLISVEKIRVFYVSGFFLGKVQLYQVSSL